MPAQRIASLLASGSEILYALGLGDQVVAVSHECDYPPDLGSKPRVTVAYIDATQPSEIIDRTVAERLARGEPLYGIDAELLSALRPDLIVTQEHCEVCAVSTNDLRAAMASQADLRDVGVVALHPTDLGGVLDDILRVGRAAGVLERAEAFVGELKNRIETVQRRSACTRRNRRPRVVCVEWIDPPMVAANWVPELIELAGGRCDLVQAGERSTRTNWSDVVAFDPQVVVIAPCGFDLERTAREAPKLRGLAGWQRLAAVLDNRVFVADGNGLFNRSGPRVVDSLEVLHHLLRHPTGALPPHLGSCVRRVTW